MTTEQSPPTTLSEERLREQFEEWANREMKGGTRRLEGGKYALDSINGAWIAWQHAAEQMARYQWIPLSERRPTHADGDAEGKVLWLYEPAGYHYCDYWDELSDHTHWMPLPPAPEKQEGGAA